ncbi:unnamed protein product [Kuraishia capsulata CBS 1993]|uniref:RING-type domain-containing protein n=1 Tax=Kuraishia capsulata CBS 1993 TaxID=1382522 RepID=W6MGW4_9ASCO|nr:uncharacterized protein KUCA_T00000825001 [Kuraishia capsulata CBS 1993]CDK24858.1 unnamed protein product [Kuraishia capsulata CBS 1993]
MSARKEAPRKAKGPSKARSQNSSGRTPGGSRSPAVSQKPTAQQVQDEDHNDLQCIICTNDLVYAALLPCGHTTCHECALRQRALYEKKSCFVCRTEQPRTTFTDLITKQFSDFTTADFASSNETYGIDFTSEHVKEEAMKLLSNTCPMKQCDATEFPSFKKLSEHVKKAHDRLYCLICAYHKKAFVSELKLYTPKQIHQHQVKGDEEGFHGHPACKFCAGKRFYSSDELFVHMRSDHEKCHVCEQIDSTEPQYFKDYPQLENHFRATHYICTVPSCLEQKFVVFRDDLDLRAHMLKDHQDIVGRNNNLFQFGVSDHGFGSQLSTFRAPTQPTRNGRNESEESKDSIETRRKRLNERARFYLNNSSEDFSEFVAINSAFDAGTMPASVINEKYKVLFKKNPEADISLLLFDLAKLYPETSEKRMQLNAITGSSTPKGEEFDKLFPALPGTTPESRVVISGWNNSQTQKKKKAINSELFPQLSGGSSSSPSISNIPSVTRSSKPVRLNVYNGPSSASSSKTSWASPSAGSKAPKIDTSKFPALEARETKYRPPRVNPVQTGLGQWGSPSLAGSGSASPISGSSSHLDLSSFSEALDASRNGTEKNRKKKGKQLLIHYGL